MQRSIPSMPSLPSTEPSTQATQNNMQHPKLLVSIEEPKKFAKVWTYNGLAIPISDEHAQFACDFANIVLLNFIHLCEDRTNQALQQAQASQVIGANV